MRGIGERRLYAIVAGVALLVLFLVAFVVKNSRDVKVSFVIFDATAPLIAVMVGCAVIGVGIGVGAAVLFLHARDGGPRTERFALGESDDAVR